jgi:hypothetical protein
VGEGQLEVREEARLVEEFGTSKECDLLTELVVWEAAHLTQEHEWNILAYDRRRLEESLGLGWEAVDASGQDGMHGLGHLNGQGRVNELIASRLSGQSVRLE